MLAAILWLALQDPPDPWAGVKEGATLTYDVCERVRVAEHSVTRVVTVAGVAAGRVTLTSQDKDDEGRAAGNRTWTVEPPSGWTDKGKETITVDRRKIVCRVVEFGEGKNRRKLWLSRDVTTVVVQEESVSEADGKKLTSRLKLAKLGEIVEVGVKLTCAVYEGEDDYGHRKVTRKEWRCADIPGWLVRSEEKDGDTVHVVDLMAFKK